MGKLKKFLAVTAALLICSGTMAYMPQNTFINADINTAYATEGSVAINAANFPDEIFRQYVADNFDINGDGVLSATEIESITVISVNDKGISDLTGIEYFTVLKYLLCNNNQLISLDVSKNTALLNLSCNSNQLTAIDVSSNTALTLLHCYDNELTTIDVSKNTALKGLYCGNNLLTSINLSKNRQLSSLICEDNTYVINLKDNKFDLSTLPTGFDISKASEWENGTVEGNILTVADITKAVSYKYDCGNETTATFTLIPTGEPVTPPTDEPVLPLGDINGDSTVDASDASNVLAVYALVSTGKESELTEAQIAAADVNKDGTIDASDASLILAYYAYISTGGTGTLEDYLNS